MKELPPLVSARISRLSCKSCFSNRVLLRPQSWCRLNPIAKALLLTSRLETFSDSLDFAETLSRLLGCTRARGDESNYVRHSGPLLANGLDRLEIAMVWYPPHIYDIRPVCGLHVGQKCQNFPSFIVKTGPDKMDCQTCQNSFLLSLTLLLFPLKR